jgi:AhpD family alkylhydroperoxidase
MSTPNPYVAWPAGLKAWKQLSDVVYDAGIDVLLLNLVMTRASQLNGCAFCLDMHTAEATAAGEDERRLHTVAAWRDAPWFTPAERAALALTEAVTLVADDRGVDEAIVADVVEQHGEEGYAKLLLAIVVINGWNRINVTARIAPRS